MMKQSLTYHCHTRLRRLKTPTAVAAFLLECMTREAVRLRELEQAICDKFKACIQQEKNNLQTFTAKLPVMVIGHIERHRKRLHSMTSLMTSLPQWIRHRVEKMDELPSRLLRASDLLIVRHTALIAGIQPGLRRAFDVTFNKHLQHIGFNEQIIKMVSPEYVLKRGYSLTFKQGKIVKRAVDLARGDEITVKFADGEKKGTIV